jgi:hypothetical protein
MIWDTTFYKKEKLKTLLNKKGIRGDVKEKTMKPKAMFVGIILSLIFVFISYAHQDDFLVLKGPYLGQKPPGMMPELFAPGFVSTESHREYSCTFIPDGKEFHFGRSRY